MQLAVDFPLSRRAKTADCVQWDTDRLVKAISLEDYSKPGKELGNKLIKTMEGKYTLTEARSLWFEIYSHYGNIEEELGGAEKLRYWSSGKWNNPELISRVKNLDPRKLRQLMVERVGLGFLTRQMLAKGISRNGWKASWKGDVVGEYWWEADGNSRSMVIQLEQAEKAMSRDNNNLEETMSWKNVAYSLVTKPHKLTIEETQS